MTWYLALALLSQSVLIVGLCFHYVVRHIPNHGLPEILTRPLF